MQWFKHDADASNDAKIKKLLLKYGATGYAVYFHCIELIVSEISESNITFELEHDSEIIADNLKIKGTAHQSGTEIVEEIMRYIIDLGLFEATNGHITCYKLLKRLDTSMTSNPRLRAIITEAKRGHDAVMIPSRQSHDDIMQDEMRIDEKRTDKNTYTPAPAADAEGPRKKPERHTYGSQGNVLLTDDEKNRLVAELGESMFTECVEFLSLYKAEKGYKSKSDNLTIRRWVIDAVNQKKAPKKVGGSFGGKPPVIEAPARKVAQVSEEERRRANEEWQRELDQMGLN